MGGEGGRAVKTLWGFGGGFGGGGWWVNENGSRREGLGRGGVGDASERIFVSKKFWGLGTGGDWGLGIERERDREFEGLRKLFGAGGGGGTFFTPILHPKIPLCCCTRFQAAMVPWPRVPKIQHMMGDARKSSLFFFFF